MTSPRFRAPLTVAAALVAGALFAPIVPSDAAPASTTSRSPLLGGGDTGWVADKDLGSLYTVTKGAGVQHAWDQDDPTRRKVTGKGVGVAIIDSGVNPGSGLAASRITYGPDLSFESQTPELRNVDTFGHGTHMAGIIAGRDLGVKDPDLDRQENFSGVAPDANLLSLKVADRDGAVDVTQVIAAIDWVVAHRNDPGLNIRVLNLSYGTDGTQSYLVDPLAHAVENAWRKGIVVVVAAGNSGNTTDSLTNPAIDPYVLAVGASDPHGTVDRKDDTVATFSSRGSATRAPDLIAPGRSIVSLRTPGSEIDVENPSAVVTDRRGARLFRGSGTSQAAAFTSGTAALLLQDRPTLTPDQVKALLTTTADPVAGADRRLQGAGQIDVDQAIDTKTPQVAVQTFAPSTGLGSLEAARGTIHVADPDTGEELTGEQDIFGQAWDGRSWADAAWTGRSWAGGDWMGRSWAGNEWLGRSWAAGTWTGANWTGRSWAGRSWAGRSWAGRSWAGRAWASATLVGLADPS